MNFTNKLTIAIPCYERKEYFIAALESALNQTLKCEVIVVDNCSSHNFFEKVCKEKGVTYHRNENNIGLFPNINKCYSLAKTEYVKILDDDDLLSPIYNESFLNAKELHPNIDVYYSDYVTFTSLEESAHPYTLPFGYMEKGFEIINFGIKHELGFPYMTSTIKRSKALLDLDVKVCVGGYDWVWVYSNANKLSFYGDNRKLHQYRIHDNKASRGKDWGVNLLTHSYIFDIILSDKTSDLRLINKISNNVFWGLVHLKSNRDKEELQKFMNSDNRFGKYLKTKLNENKLLRTTFILPKELSTSALLLLKTIRRFNKSLAIKNK